MAQSYSKSELRQQIGGSTPGLLALVRSTAVTSIRSLQWFKRSPDSRLQSLAELEFLGLAFYLLSREALQVIGADQRELFMDDLMLFVLAVMTDGMQEDEAHQHRTLLHKGWQLNWEVLCSYEQSPHSPGETTEQSVLWLFSRNLAQTIKGHALDIAHMRKLFSVSLEFRNSLNKWLSETLDRQSG